MSGIALAWGREAPGLVEKMLHKLEHRGPGKRKMLPVGRGTLGYVAPGPSSNDTVAAAETVSLVMDGRIYGMTGCEKEEGGQVSLRDPTRLLSSFCREEDAGDLRGLDGEFALAVSDGTDLLVVRDPLGVKPLYYARHDDLILFASEIKALPPDVNEVGVFPPGSFFHSACGFVDYYTIQPPVTGDGTDMGPEEAGRALRRILQGAVEKRVGAQDTVGVFLSGGLDSSVVAALAAEVVGDVHSFAAGAEGGGDLQHAARVAEYLGTKHHEYVITPAEIKELLPQVIYHLESFDPPLVRSSLANFVVGREASRAGLQAVLCGEGSDELFCGYHYLKDFDDPAELRHELVELMQGLPQNGMQRVDRMTEAHALEGYVPFLDMDVVDFAWGLPVEYKIHGRGQVEKWILRHAFADMLPGEVVWRRKAKFFEGAGLEDAIQRVAEQEITDDEFARYRATADGLTLRSKEELYCYRIFREFFPNPAVVETIGWTRTEPDSN